MPVYIESSERGLITPWRRRATLNMAESGVLYYDDLLKPIVVVEAGDSVEQGASAWCNVQF